MKTKISIFLALLTITFLFSGCSRVNDVLITTQSSPDKNYQLAMYQVGEPAGCFSSVKGKLVLQTSDGEVIRELLLELANDGANITEENIVEVKWSEDSVEVYMMEFDTTREIVYSIDY